MPHRIIAISRQFGSGGHEISVRLSQLLNQPCYDKDLIIRAARESGLSMDTLAPTDERCDPVSVAADYHGLSQSDTLFIAQAKIIRRIAAQEDCILVGRCSDVILRDTDARLLRVFIHAPMEARIQRIQRLRKLSARDARQLIRESDQARREYYGYYTETGWGAQDNYDISLDSAFWGIEKSAALLAETARML